MRIAIVYDCLFPNTVGGAERWYRNLAERLDGEHRVIYLTRRQWGEEGPGSSFSHARGFARRRALYAFGPAADLASGPLRDRRPLAPARHGRRYDAVHMASFPYFSLLGAGLALRLNRSRARLIVDWHEIWSREYWRSYLGRVGGRIADPIQAITLRLPDRSSTFSRLAEARARELGHRAPISRLTGEFAENEEARRRLIESASRAALAHGPRAGRQIPEKRVPTIPGAIAGAARECRSALHHPRRRPRGRGDARGRVGFRAPGTVELPGRVDHATVMRTIAQAACLVHPSRREGYGLTVVEAASLGTPAVLVSGPDNAATELVEEGVNGFVVADPSPESLGGPSRLR